MALISKFIWAILLAATTTGSAHASFMDSNLTSVAQNENNTTKIPAFPLCSEVLFDPRISGVQTGYCVSKYVTTPHLTSRSIGDSSEPDLYTPQDEPDFAWFKNDLDGKKDWCSTGGSVPNRKHVKELCNSIPNEWKLGRAPSILSNLGCLCRTWMNHGEVFGVCNCDRCDSLVVDHLQQKCKYLEDRCIKNHFNSGYFTQEPPLWQSAYTFLYSVGNHSYETTEKVHNYVRASLNTSCLSGNPFKKGQDWSGAPHCENRKATWRNFWNVNCW